MNLRAKHAARLSMDGRMRLLSVSVLWLSYLLSLLLYQRARRRLLRSLARPLPDAGARRAQYCAHH